MRKLLAIAGMLTQLFYFTLTVLSYGDYPYSGSGMGKGFALMVMSALVLILCLTIYLAEAIWSVFVNRQVLDVVKLSTVILCVPFGCFCIGQSIPCVVTWNSFFLLFFVFELVMLFRKKSKATS